MEVSVIQHDASKGEWNTGTPAISLRLLKAKSVAGFSLKLTLLCVLGVVMAFPFVWMALSALKTKTELMDISVFFPHEAQWGNFSEVLFNSPIPRYILNSAFVSVVSVAYQLFTGALFAYAVVFMEFRGRNVLFALVLGCYMIPGVATYVPCYVLLAQMDLLDSYGGLIISTLVSIFGIFLLRQSFMQIPRDLISASRMDRSNHWTTLWKIVFPLTKGTFLSFALINFIVSYNSYLWPSLITNKPELALVSQGLRQFFIEGGAYGTNWALVMAASTVVVSPLLLFFALIQKQFITGISGNAGLKG